MVLHASWIMAVNGVSYLLEDYFLVVRLPPSFLASLPLLRTL